jgi:hypothetical protein
LPIGSKKVEAEAISLRIDRGQQFSAEGGPERGFEDALEYRELNPLAMILAELGDLTVGRWPTSRFASRWARGLKNVGGVKYMRRNY